MSAKILTPHYILEESIFDFRHVRLYDTDIRKEKCGVWSGSALFASNPFRGLQSLLWVKLYPYYNNEFAEMRDHITRAIQ